MMTVSNVIEFLGNIPLDAEVKVLQNYENVCDEGESIERFEYFLTSDNGKVGKVFIRLG